MKKEFFVYNKVEGRGKIGIVIGGILYFYVKEVIKGFEDLFLILKIIVVYFLDEGFILEFVKGKEMLIFVEEFDLVLEEEVKLIFFENGRIIFIYGK